VATLMVQNGFDERGLAKSTHDRHEMRNLVYQAVIVPTEASNAGPPTQ
jgi:hypothetical protein